MNNARKINYHFIAGMIGKMCFIEVAMTLLCLGVSIYYGEDLLPFSLASLSYLLLGILFFRYSSNEKANTIRIGRREGMLSVTITWLILSLGAVVPLLLSKGSTNNFFAALFETVSGFTTTGATIYDHIGELQHSILFWRALMQWQGGIGIVVFTVAFIPVLTGGASHIFNAETTGITHDRFLPKISDVAKRILVVYLIETAILIVLLFIGPMGLFDAVCHAFSCISTGGYSTQPEGILHYNSPYTEYVLSLFMYVGALNMTLVYFALFGKPLFLIMDEEFRWFTLFILFFTSVTTIWLWHNGLYSSLEETFRRALFQCVSLGSSTGFLTADITLWKPFFWIIAFTLMFINGCAGSTSGGLKMSRFIVLMKNLRNEFKKQIRPHLITPVIINGRQLSVSIVHQILAFCVLFVLLILLSASLIMLDGNGFDTSLSIAVACISNSGPGIDTYVSSVASAGDLTKTILSFLMLAGRLEVFTVIGILTPYFWSK